MKRPTKRKMEWTLIACEAWRFLSKLSVLRKRGNQDNKPQSCEEPGRETTEKLPAQMAGIFC